MVERQKGMSAARIANSDLGTYLAFWLNCRILLVQSDTKKTGTFEKHNKNWRNQKKKILTEIEPLQLAF